jgi:hypothetical protein
MKPVRWAFLIAVMSATATNAAFGETWQCEITLFKDAPPAPTKYVIVRDRVRSVTESTPPSGLDLYQVVRNNDRVLVAFFRVSRGQDNTAVYLIIDKRSGTLVGMNDGDMRGLGPTCYARSCSETAGPEVNLGHCIQSER